MKKITIINLILSVTCSGYTANYTDWRLPNINELESLVNAQQSNPASWLNSHGFSGVQSNYYWSSSTDASYTSNAWLVNFHYDYVYTGQDGLPLRSARERWTIWVIW